MIPSLELVLISRLWSRHAWHNIYVDAESDHHAGHMISLEDLLAIARHERTRWISRTTTSRATPLSLAALLIEKIVWMFIHATGIPIWHTLGLHRRSTSAYTAIVDAISIPWCSTVICHHPWVVTTPPAQESACPQARASGYRVQRLL